MNTSTSPEPVTRKRQFLRNIVVAVDLTARSLETADYAVSIAKPFGASVVFVYVYPDDMTFDFVAAGRYDLIDAEQRDQRHALMNLTDRASHTYPFCSQVFLVGNPAKTVVEYADDIEADLIIAGSHHPGFLATLLHLDQAPKMARLATCPVLIYRSECDQSDQTSDWYYQP
jgi:nucleotide-binding universal stress UspA family protein